MALDGATGRDDDGPMRVRIAHRDRESRAKRATPGTDQGAADGPSDLDATPIVDILVCGSIEGDDDAVLAAACERLEGDRPRNARIYRIGQLDVDDLLSVPIENGVVVVDVATGIDPGAVVELPLRGLLSHETTVETRYSHALALPEVIGLVDMLRGRPLVGRMVLIGVRRFAMGRPVARRVAAATPALLRAIRLAVERVAETSRQRRNLESAAAGC
jgi:hypothetical protein